MKIREQKLIWAEIIFKERTSCMKSAEYCFSYDTMKKIINNELENIEVDVYTRYSYSSKRIIPVKNRVDFIDVYLDLFNKVENLIKLEEDSRETDLILAKKQLIDELIEESKDNINNRFVKEIINTLKTE